MKVSIKDADRAFLEAMALSLARDIDRGENDKRALLEEVMAEIPRSPEYDANQRRN
jgi:hypothetical protein